MIDLEKFVSGTDEERLAMMQRISPDDFNRALARERDAELRERAFYLARDMVELAMQRYALSAPPSKN